jgi:lysozyme
MNLDNLATRTKLHEGFRRKPYQDTVGKLTVGYGRNLDDVGISEQEAEFMLMNDLNGALLVARGLVDHFDQLADHRQEALVEMAFNLGATRLAKFHNMIAAVEAGDFEKAADEMLDSLWAKQVKGRAKELSDLMRAG